MATATSKSQCITCGKDKGAVRCEGCLQIFCRNHLIDHCQELNKQLDEIEVNRDVFRQTLTEQINDSNKYLLIQQINKWEEDSIKIIQQTANECRQILIQYRIEHINQIEVNLNILTDQLREIRQENDFNEINLNDLKQKLTQLVEELDKPSNISIQQDSTTLINKISIAISSRQILPPNHININRKWVQNGITIAGGHGKGNGLNQLSQPYGIYVDNNGQNIYIADYLNHRIVKWQCDVKNGQIVAGENGKEQRIDQLRRPTDVIMDTKNDSLIISDYGNRRVIRWPLRNNADGQIIIFDIDCIGLAMDNNGDLYVSDYKKNEVRRYKIGDTDGIIVAGGNGVGNHLNQLNYPTYIFIDQDYSVYVSDSNNHRVMKWIKDAKEGMIVAGGQGQGNSLTQLSYPQGVLVDHFSHVYVADSHNYRIMRWWQGSREGSVIIGGNGKGNQSNQFSFLGDLSFDRQSNLYVADYGNNRIQKFDIIPD